MNNADNQAYDDGSIVVVTAESCQEEMENGESYVLSPYAFPAMSDSQQLSDSTHKQLQDILKENNELRDSLHKNNTEMKQLLTAFRDYQDKTLQSRTLHKQRINSVAKDCQLLKDENISLARESQELKTQLKMKQVDINKLQETLLSSQKCLSEHAAQISTLKEDLRRAELTILTSTSQISELETEVSVLKLDREKLHNQTEALIEQLDKQNSCFREQLSTASHRYTNSESEVLSLKEELAQHQLQMLALKNDIQNLSKLNVDLQKEMEKQHTAGVKRAISEDDDMGFSIVNNQDPLDDAVLQKQLDDGVLQKQLEQEEHRCQELQQTIAQQKEQLNKLEKQLAEQQVLSPSIQEAESAEQFFKAREITKLKAASTVLQDCEERYQSIGQQLGACQERLQYLKIEDDSKALMQGLQSEVEMLKQLLSQEEQEKKILENRIEQLSENYRQVLASWEIYESEQQTKGRQTEALTAIEKRQHQEKLDELMAQNVALEEEAQAKDQELTSFKRQIALLNRETESMPILRAQVEVYRQDFIKERDEKAKALSSSDLLRQEINSLQAQLNELRDEPSSHQDQPRRDLNLQQGHHQQELTSSGSHQIEENDDSILQPVEVFVMPRSTNTRVKSSRATEAEHGRTKHRGHHKRRSSPPPSEENSRGSGSQTVYECPSCKMTYTSITAVENHLEGCLQEDRPYP